MPPSSAATRIGEIAAAFDEQVAQIRSNPDLSADGKQRRIADAYKAANAARDRVLSAQAAATERRDSSLERDLFGLPRSATAADIAVHRQSVEQVKGIRDPGELTKLMNEAERDGDRVLLRAAAAHAWRNGADPLAGRQWRGLAEEYAQQNGFPLDDLAEAGGWNAHSLTDRFTEQGLIRSLREPAELASNYRPLPEERPDLRPQFEAAMAMVDAGISLRDPNPND